MFNWFKKKGYDEQYNEELEKRLSALVKDNSNLLDKLRVNKGLLSVKDNILAQNKVAMENYQNEIDHIRLENKSMLARNEKLFDEVKGMKISVMSPKDAHGRLFSRIAPMIDNSGYELMKSGEGRMKLKLIHADGSKSLVFVEIDKGA